ncbi:MAG: hypothetical protein BMS9Abin12_1407 [Acidimicrobiia bacterium]|nr:MAG: hypothetical protein BMS9Abin12_1407 [Acidimicrobiia bacterium]
MMARRMFNALPGPTPVRIILATIILVVAFIALMFVYDWMGNNLLDSGGTIS